MTIRFENVTYRYADGKGGLTDINFDVKTGELLAVIGPSGSGKSTLLKLLAGFMDPQQGRIEISGRDMKGVAARHRDLGIVFQSYALFPHMTVLENIAYPLQLRRVARDERIERACKALQEVGLAHAGDRLPATLSGGQQQRVALARALVYQPKALLLDEPLSALDASLRGEMRDLITHIQRTANIAAILVTHDQEEALSMADRVAVIHEGSLLQLAAPRDLYDNPVDKTVAAFVGKANLWPGKVLCPNRVLTELGEVVCNAEDWQVGASVTLLVRPEAVMPVISAHSAAEGGTHHSVNYFQGDLVQDRFLGAVRRYDIALGDQIITGETGYRGTVAGVSIAPDQVRILRS
ncbi:MULTISPECIES: ABC transporter ATP-binding protein [Thalassospira]|jgi:putative spermidine/putrescine transport system ATP-binding protein|uniref:ABC transporter ATP-binding protein n=2 Tax=Thalassospira TaxID=168934 RepID=A0ABR5Y4U5_9PROT|nr:MULTISPECIES: ABC transporter ATP-binding protein [Thalassospira]MBL4841121.1 ABC transporter ATP-binding protein [Thalassospira sp.]MBR9781925.1 ABC transporter ATP-binding protein [Rhodospirillales bacterium]KZD05941.1 ABC transporter ATP-binding protein [Thalassospira xiamenensis]KZD07465.1 ABC transporter ATP-binding protein [Thalassospira xiamenensis]MBR9816453.1 ABC transporter ATP-binding protein [Rhodospirillales bacterium]|tara:strand:- start:282 stop:1334 length:1053 start_codon:yes stop_codon:yes gene_type:complete